MLLLLLAAAQAGALEARAGPPLSGARFDHIGLSVADPELSAQFYQRVLGLKPIPLKGLPNMRWLDAGTFQLHLIGGLKKPVDRETDTHLALRVDNLADELRILDRNNVPWTDSNGAPHKVSTRFDGVMQAYFFDRDGYQVEVNQAPPR